MDRIAILSSAFAATTLGLGLTGARLGFDRRIGRLERELVRLPAETAPRTDLPAEIAALAARLGASGRRGPAAVELRQAGQMWRQPGNPPLAFTARQVIAVDRPGFVWRARFGLPAGLSLQVVDYLVGEAGDLEGRLLGVVPVMQLAGSDEAFRGEAMRYLGELPWNPDAILFNRALHWRVIDRRTFAVAMGESRRWSEVRLSLDEAGDVVRVDADDRPREQSGVLAPCRWFGRCLDYRLWDGRRLPSLAEAGWIDGSGEFVYWRGRIEWWRG